MNKNDFAQEAQALALEKPAATAVLNTNELLKQILTEVPREYRVDLRRGSKTWKHVVSEIGYTVEPVCVPLYIDHGFPNANKPYYPNHLIIKCHTAMCDNQYYGLTVSATLPWDMFTKRTGLLFMRRGFGGGVFYEETDEFLTNPPITQVAVISDCGLTATLRVRDGIRITHLYEAYRKIEDVKWVKFAVSAKVTLPGSRTKYVYCDGRCGHASVFCEDKLHLDETLDLTRRGGLWEISKKSGGSTRIDWSHKLPLDSDVVGCEEESIGEH